MVVSSAIKFRSKKDENPLVENVTYYRVLKDIIELDYYEHFKFVLFKCHWFQIKQDGFGLVLINFPRLIYENDPFVFASQVKQVYYTKDPNDDWHVVTNTTPKGLFDIYSDLENEDVEKHLDDQLRSSMFVQFTVNENENIWFRDDVPGTTIDASLTDNGKTREEPRQESLDD